MLNAISVSGTGIVSSLVGGVIGLFGESLDQKARVQAEAQGSTQMKERLRQGFTLTLDLEQRQVDFMIGNLAAGELPQRPYPRESGLVWQVNQRSLVWPGGFDFAGPIAAQQGQTTFIDAELEEGEGAALGVFCASALEAFAKAVTEGGRISMPQGELLTELRPTQSRQRVSLPHRNCPMVLAIVPTQSAQLPVKLRYRVASAQVAPSSNLPASSSAQGPVHITLSSVSIRPKNAEGGAWDVVGGEADVYIKVSSAATQRELFRSHVIHNKNEARFDQALGRALEQTGFPLRFSLMDEDSTTDEIIGFTELEYATALSALNNRGEIALPVRALNTTGTQVGILRLKVSQASQHP